ncbi:MAG: hypothetical protein AAGC81_17905 [Pseudomonadota bacterium]
MNDLSHIPSSSTAKYRRRPEDVMRLARMGSFHPTRLSFLRQLLRRLEAEDWRFERRAWEIDATGVGHALYCVHGPERSYTLVAFAHDLPDEMRSDRVIATAWDATFTLFDGVPEAADIERLRQNVPLQEAGRVSARELSLSRANRSFRLFDHVVERLAEGRQPEPEALKTGYLMRTTAVYGSGKFGAADRDLIAGRAELSSPFQAEMLSVWLIRAFTIDIVEHLAEVRGGEQAARLDPEMRRGLGVGNSTGLGMAPYLVNHPVLINNWMLAREEALARVRAQPVAGTSEIAGFRAALAAAAANAAFWDSAHPLQVAKLAELRADLATLQGWAAEEAVFAADHPWDALWHRAEALSLEGQEALVAAMLEPHGELVDGLGQCMGADEGVFFRIDGAMRVGAVKTILAERYDWAMDVDYAAPEQSARFWYVSEEKLEPRLGERHDEEGAELEQPLAIGRDAKALSAALSDWPEEETVAAFLLAEPDHRHMVRRAQIAAHHPFAEIQNNLISAEMLPIDLLRCKLSFFGASRFDPRSDRWVRICLYQDAPYPGDLLSPV